MAWGKHGSAYYLNWPGVKFPQGARRPVKPRPWRAAGKIEVTAGQTGVTAGHWPRNERRRWAAGSGEQSRAGTGGEARRGAGFYYILPGPGFGDEMVMLCCETLQSPYRDEDCTGNGLQLISGSSVALSTEH